MFYGSASLFMHTSPQKLCMNCVIQGVVKVQHHTGKVVRQTEKLVVTFLAEKQPGRPNLGTPSVSLRWVSLSELRGLSTFVMDTVLRILVQSVHSGAAVYPPSLVECLDVQGARKGYVVNPLHSIYIIMHTMYIDCRCTYIYNMYVFSKGCHL